jgi:hypothetical protein
MLDHAAELDREVAQLRGLLIRGAASASMPAEQG